MKKAHPCLQRKLTKFMGVRRKISVLDHVHIPLSTDIRGEAEGSPRSSVDLKNQESGIIVQASASTKKASDFSGLWCPGLCLKGFGLDLL